MANINTWPAVAGRLWEMEKWRKTIPILDETFKEKGFVKIADKKFYIVPDTLKGPLEEGWEEMVKEFAADIAP